MASWRLLMTGPTLGLDRWVEALEHVPAYVTESLEVLERPVLQLDQRAMAPIVHRPDWLCVTSQSALPGLALRWIQLAGIPCAVVGEQSAAELRAHGLSVEAGPSPSAEALLKEWLPRLGPGQRVLWPRGSESDALAGALRSKGVIVDDPIAYRTRVATDRRALPAAELVFFASPSGVRAYLDLEHVEAPGATTAIAIGSTTAAALRAIEPSPFGSVVELDAPEPAALVRVLERLRRTQP